MQFKFIINRVVVLVFKTLIDLVPYIICVSIGLFLLLNPTIFDYIYNNFISSEMNQTRLNPIYTAISNEEYDNAIKLCDAKDIKGYAITKSLKCYSLVCLGKTKESLELGREVLKNYKCDDTVLSTLTQTFRSAKKEHEMVPSYELAIQNDPTNEYLLVDLFALFVRIGDKKKMQVIAMKLYKNTLKPIYVFWSVFSMLQQNDLPQQMMIVAERMIQKIFFETNPIIQPGAEELELYISLMLRQNKIEEALTTLDLLRLRSLGSPIEDDKNFQDNVTGSMVKLHELRYCTLRAEILTLLKRNNNDLTHQLKDIIGLYPDQWTAHNQLVDIIASESIELIEESIVSHQQYLLEIQTIHSRLRGPYLAELLLLSKWIALKKQNLPKQWIICTKNSNYVLNVDESNALYVLYQEFCQLIVKFISKFQTKQCCFSDIKPYVTILNQFPSLFLHSIRVWSSSCANLIATELEFNTTINTSIDCSDIKEAISIDDIDVINNTNEIITEHSEAVSAAISKNTKKKKAKKAKSKAEAEAAKVVIIPIEQDKNRDIAINLLCSHSKMSQISYYCGTIDNNIDSVDISNSLLLEQSRRISLFKDSKISCGGGIGGEREVQPGDELLLLCSTANRVLYSLPNNTSNPILSTSGCNINKLSRSINWASLLLFGMEQSQYTYTFRLEILEPLRQLGVGESALVAFNAMGAKYVQNDSMSYLIIPSLLEAGLFDEAFTQHRKVILFHVNAKKETTEMINKCLKYCNFMKALELVNFIERCQKSIQLALSKVEYAIHELISTTHTLDSSIKYLQDYINGEALESQSFLEENDLDSLYDNMDYGLLIRTDVSVEIEQNAAKIRKLQYQYRIKESQLVIRMLSFTLSGDYDNGCEYLQRLIDHVNVVITQDTEVNSIKEVLNNKVDYLQWDQSISCGSNEYKSIIWNCIHSITTLCLSNDAINKNIANETNSNQVLTNLVEATKSIAVTCINNINQIKAKFSNSCSYIIIAEDNSSSSVINPEWIQEISFFMKSLATWGSVLLQKLFNSSKINDKLTNLYNIISNICNNFIELLTLIENKLSIEINIERNNIELVKQFDNYNNLTTSNLLPVNILQDYNIQLADQMISSHQLSCSRLHLICLTKNNILKKILNKTE